MRYNFVNEAYRYLCREAGIQRSTDYSLDYVESIVKAREYEARNRGTQCHF